MAHKPFRTIDEQIQLLRNDKHLIIPNEEEDNVRKSLSDYNYYRLSGYSLTLRKNDKFSSESRFSDIMQIYDFDRDLRLCVLKYLEDIEIALRTHLAYELGRDDTEYLVRQGYERGQIGNQLFFRLLVIIRLSPIKSISDIIISDIKDLQHKYPFVDLKYYGFKRNWEDIIKSITDMHNNSST